ncbi:MAG: DNA-directed RNA polymerase subunit alpha C-terminal domain-containing protein [Phycisphaerae bacterium]
MENVDPAALVEIMQKDAWNQEDAVELTEMCFRLTDSVGKLRAALGQLESENPEPKGAVALKIGICRYLLARYGEAISILSEATDNKERHYYLGLCYQQIGRYQTALESYERAASKGWEESSIALKRAEAFALARQFDQAEKALKESALGEDDPDFLYTQGLIRDLTGYTEQAAEAYEKALEIDEDHSPSLFRLAYWTDLHGHEDEAIDLYKDCLDQPPIFANALLNLAVLYEDAGENDKAVDCLHRILKANPNHQRAKLFLRDAEASKNMFFDEDQARRVAKRNAVLDIPVTDFELSVRARNCLKKMNIRTLGDLIKTTEAELLAYKNFGETSLKEIKDMLSAKGLRLGQALEEGSDFATKPTLHLAPPPGSDDRVLSIPMDQIEFSVRARRAIDNLGLKTIGELAHKTEVELMSCKNFGQTSLNEVRQRLSEHGLSLREPQ